MGRSRGRRAVRAMNPKGFQIGLALAVEACLLFGLGMWLANFTHTLLPHVRKVPVTVRWMRRLPPPARKSRTLVHPVPSASPVTPPLSAPAVIHMGDTLALSAVRSEFARIGTLLPSVPWTPRKAGLAKGKGARGGGGGRRGRLPLPGWGLPDSGLRVRQISFVCPKPVDRPGAIIFEARVNTQGRVGSAWVVKSNWDLSDQVGVIWAVRFWRFAPLVINGRPTPFEIVGTIRVPAHSGAKAICAGLIAAGGMPWRFIPFTWVLEHPSNSGWFAFSVARGHW